MRRAEAGTGRVDWTDRVLELDVGPVAHGGHCVARHEGRVVFVRHTLPGERVRAVVTEDGTASYCRADTVTVLAASPDRVEAPCTWARAGGCGGCDFQHAGPGAQRNLKAAVVAEALRRIGGIERDVTVEELPGGPLGWRRRIRLATDDDGAAGLRPHRSHEVLRIADCPLFPPGVLPAVLADAHPPAGEVEVVLDADDGLHVGPGPEPVVARAAGREWRLSPGTFWQVHPALADVLAGVVASWSDAPDGGVAWDLYGGVGLFASVLAGQVGEAGSVTVVESSRRAVADGRAGLVDLPQVRWRPGRVEHLVGSLPGPPDVVVADPPRRGLGRATVEALCARAPGRVLHVACDPAALARDAALFTERGYALAELRAFDAFPMTHHVECVALFHP